MTTITDNGKNDFAAAAKQTLAEFNDKLATLSSRPEWRSVENLRVAFLGRKGELQKLMASLRQVSREERPRAGKIVNDLQKEIEGSIEKLKQQSIEWETEKRLNEPHLDVTLPVHLTRMGSLHPVSIVRRLLLKEFRKMGFIVYDGPEVELDFYNFSALNFSEDHPARDMQDTFFVSEREKTILRTHTSNIQIHAMLQESPPLRIVAPGRTFRCDSDQTHTPMFHQIEGFVVDRNITMGDMKGVIEQFLSSVLNEHVETRLRPSYFPFVEPGAEIDIRWQGKSQWLEVGGLGMIHPNVFEAVEYDSETYTGFAFGFGIDRLAMLKFGLTDLRQLFEGSYKLLGQFPVNI